MFEEPAETLPAALVAFGSGVPVGFVGEQVGEEPAPTVSTINEYVEAVPLMIFWLL